MSLKVEVAQREKLKIPVLLSGVSGSGKTLSALFLAYGIVSEMFPELTEEERWLKVGIIDTEHRRSLLYTDSEQQGIQIHKFNFVDLEKPFTVDRYEEAFYLLKDIGCEVIIIDSTSHNWEAEGGMLDQVEMLGGQFSAWNKVKPLEERFRELAINPDVHVISTSRVKQDYVVEANEKGKMAPRKVGLKGIQKDSLEFEYAISFRIEQNALAYPMKDNSNIFDTPKQLTVEDGRKLYQWSEIGLDVAKIQRELKEQEQKELINLRDELAKMSQVSEYSAVINRAQIAVGTPFNQFDFEVTKKLYDQLKEMNIPSNENAAEP